MMTNAGPQISQENEANRNIMLYWDDANPFPPDVVKVSETWRNFCPGWNVTLFGKETALRFLRDNFGGDIARLFLTCAIPAMRADFFRVFWAISEGGIYSDLAFAPIREPLFFDAEKNLTVVKRPGGEVIRNGIFFSKKNCDELKLIAYEIMVAVGKKEIPCIWQATGPGAWTKTLQLSETSTVAILDWKDLYGNFIKYSKYSSLTWSTDKHWKYLQRIMSIYQEPPETPEESL